MALPQKVYGRPSPSRIVAFLSGWQSEGLAIGRQALASLHRVLTFPLLTRVPFRTMLHMDALRPSEVLQLQLIFATKVEGLWFMASEAAIEGLSLIHDHARSWSVDQFRHA